jgi:acyl carrier protein
MTRSLIESRLRAITASVFGLPEEQLPSDADQSNLVAWDSLGHLRLIVALEGEFGIRFRTDRIARLTSLALLLDEITHADHTGTS